jgi:hypothetical protein
MHQPHLFGFQCGVRALDVDIELRRPANGGAAFHIIAFGPLGQHRFVAHDVRNEIQQALRHSFFDNQVRFLDDDLFANVIERHENRRHPKHPILHLRVENGIALFLSLSIEQGAVGDVACFGRDIQRAVELI